MTFERLLITNSAPTLANMKCSSLICLKGLDGSAGNVVLRLERKGLRFRFLSNHSGNPLLFVFRPNKLREAINQPGAREYLESIGYDTEDLEGCLSLLEERMRDDDFPHEIGFFLGYPATDVLAYISEKGRNYISSGLWRVYSNREKAERTFSRYEKCRNVYMKLFSSGFSIDRLCIATA